MAGQCLSALISRIESGEVLDLGRLQVNQSSSELDGEQLRQKPSQETEINGDWLRMILMGLPLPILIGKTAEERADEEPEVRPVKVTPAGIRIASAFITGELNLNDLAGIGGAPLPVLQFDRCEFQKEINLRRCHLRSLSLKDCRFSELQAEESVIDGPVKLSGVRRQSQIAIKDRNGVETESFGAYVVLRGAKIGGHIDCAHASFAATPRRSDEEPHVENSKHPRFGLDLRAAQIRGSVLLRPGVTALGGISFTLAHVEGSIWLNGAELTAGEDCAFSADYADIKGSLYLRTYDPPNKSESIQFLARGEVSLFATRLGGSLYLEGAKLEGCKPDAGGRGPKESLDAMNSTIGGSCKLTCWQSFTNRTRVYPFTAIGGILMESASIRNDVHFGGSDVQAVHAENISVGGDFDMSVYVAPEARSLESLRATATEVHLEGAVIKGDMLMTGARLGRQSDTANKDHGLFARGARIGGNCDLATNSYRIGTKDEPVRFECYGRVQMPEAVIGNSLLMSGARVVYKHPHPLAAVDIAGTTIGGHAKFMAWSPDGSADCISFELDADLIAMRVTGAKIAQKLILNGAIIKASRTAIDGGNVEVGSKASLGTYKSRSFNAMGQVNLASANINLGLDMKGARIRLPTSQGTGNTDEVPRQCVALDLTLARMKFVRLVQLEAVGQVVLQHAQIDTDLKLTDSRFEAPIRLDFAKIGTSVDLTGIQLWCGTAQAVYERISASYDRDNQSPDLVKGSALAEMAQSHTSKRGAAELSLNSARIGGALIVSGLKIFARADPANGRQSSMPDELKLATIDLRGLHVQEMRDDGGKGWSASVRFWLEGFFYTRLAPPDQPPGSPFYKAAESPSENLPSARLRWLDQQYFNRNEPQIAEFTPGAYEQLVKTLNIDGLYEEAHKVTSARLDREREVSRNLWHKFFWWFLWLAFGYGFSRRKAFCTFLLCILVGTGAAYVADYGLKVPYLPPVEKVLIANRSLSEGRTDEGDLNKVVDCHDRIQSGLYALDVFVPVLDLKQQSACSIRRDKPLWRWAQALYRFLGWVLVPITVLTFSGILKKHLER
jgi:hypothetical protein